MPDLFHHPRTGRQRPGAMLGHLQQRIHESSVGGNCCAGEVATIGSHWGIPAERRYHFVNRIARLEADQ
jgi:hypothetical protein